MDRLLLRIAIYEIMLGVIANRRDLDATGRSDLMLQPVPQKSVHKPIIFGR
jgi:hypothetical protein